MTQEEKQLLIKDLCARLPYGVICQLIWTYSNETTDGEDVISKEDDNLRGIDIHTEEVQADYYGEWVDLENCKPYLRPMSSMTEEEREEVEELIKSHKPSPDGIINNKGMDNLLFSVSITSGYLTDWLNKKMFDYRGLIPMGLALEAPDEMYKIN